jgi:hypothetical protein
LLLTVAIDLICVAVNIFVIVLFYLCESAIVQPFQI